MRRVLLGALLVVWALGACSAPTTPEPLPTVAVTATATAIATATVTPVPTYGARGEAGFMLAFAEEMPTLPADGITQSELTVTTTLAQFVGETVQFIVFGGGDVRPSSATLPPLGETLKVVYTSGTSASDVRIEARVAHEGLNYTADASASLAFEALQLTGRYGLPADPQAPIIPIAYTLEGEGAPLSGQYRLLVNVVGAQGSVTLDPSGANASSEIMLDFGADVLSERNQLIFFVPPLDSRVTSAIVTANLLGRRDIPPVRLVVRWRDLERTMVIRELEGVSPSRNAPERSERLIWNPLGENKACLSVFTDGGKRVAPNELAVSYLVLLSPAPQRPHLALAGSPLMPNTVLTSEERDLRGERYLPIAQNEPTCLATTPLAQGGVIALTIAGGVRQTLVQTLVILQFDSVGLGLIGRAGEPVWLRDSEGTSVTATLFRSNQTAFALERVTGRSLTVMTMIPLWVLVEQVDAEQNLLLPQDGQINLYGTLEEYEAGRKTLNVRTENAIADVWAVRLRSGDVVRAPALLAGETRELVKVYLMLERSAR